MLTPKFGEKQAWRQRKHFGGFKMRVAILGAVYARSMVNSRFPPRVSSVFAIPEVEYALS